MRTMRRHPFDTIVVLLAVVAEIKVWVAPGTGPRAVFIVGTLLWTLPLLARRRFPFAAPVVAFAAQAAVAFADPRLGVETTMTVAWLLTFWVVGACNEGRQALVGATVGFASLAVVAQQDVHVGLNEVIWGYVWGAGVCLIAYALQRRAERATALEGRAAALERDREEQTRAAVAEERKRIARELHDVIGHTVSVMTVQAGAARLLLDEDPDRAVGPLLSVEETGRQALAEIRRLLGLIGEEAIDAPFGRRPGVADLETLVAGARDAGLTVHFAVQGDPRPLPPAIELAAYRIVQEALTNARKHGGRERADVSLRYAHNAIEVEIENDGRRFTTRHGGHGLIGMRERVALYGGELDAGPRAGGGFHVRARLPVKAARA